MTQIQDFKENAYQSVWDHGKALFKHLVLPSILFFIVMGLVMGLSINFIIGSAFEELMIMISESGGVLAGADPTAIFLEWFESQPNAGSMIFGIVVMVVFFLVAVSWFINLCLLMSQDQLVNGTTSFGSMIGSSFNRNVWIILAVTLLVQIGQSVIENGLGMVIGENVILGLLVQLLVTLLALRFVAATPAVALGSMGVGESLRFSWENVTWRRAGLILLIFIGVGIVIGLGTFAFVAIAQALGTVGAFIVLIAMLGLMVFGISLYTSFLSGIFFRYADVEIEEGESDAGDHLVEEL